MSAPERWVDLKGSVGGSTVREIATALIAVYLERYVPIYETTMGDEPKRIKATACNIFFTDIVQQLRISGPYHWVDKKGNPLRFASGVSSKGRELSANGTIEWFRTHGKFNGLTKCNVEAALSFAASNKLVAVTWHSNSQIKSGHIAAMLEDGTIAQAGRGMPFVGRALTFGFGFYPVEFWTYTGAMGE